MKNNKILKVFETFSGIGAQHIALEWLKEKFGYNYELSYTSEWDIDGIIVYALIHYNKIFKIMLNDLTLDKVQLLVALNDYTFSKDCSTPLKHNLLGNIGIDKLKALYVANILNKNLGSIKGISGKEIQKDIDLLTYSFPCTDLSVAGGFWGFNKGMGQESNTRSSLIWEIGRIISDLKDKNKLPKFLLMENVKNIISKKHIGDFEKWKDLLTSMGYKHFTKIVNAYDYGIPQKRQRVFLISSLDWNEKEIEKTFESFDKNLLETKNLKSLLKTNYDNKIYKEEALEVRPNRTKSRFRMWNENFHLEKDNVNWIRTLTTKQDRNPNAGTISLKGSVLETYDKIKTNYRFLSPREAFLLMGFSETNFDNIKEFGLISKQKLYQQAGNSIVVNAIIPVIYTILKLFNSAKNKGNK